MRFITLPVTASARQPFPVRLVTLASTVVRAGFPTGDVVRPALLPHG